MRWVLRSEECTNYQEYEYNAKATIQKLKGHLSQSLNCQENLSNSTQTKYKLNHIVRVWKVYLQTNLKRNTFPIRIDRF